MANTFWSNLCNGVCGTIHIKSFPTDNLPVGILYHQGFQGRGIRHGQAVHKKAGLVHTAQWRGRRLSGNEAVQALSQGENKNIDPFRLGVYFGSGIGGFATQYREISKMIEILQDSGSLRCSSRR